MITTTAIDTNIIIKAFNGNEACSDIINNKIPVISVIIEIELLSWPGLNTDDYQLLSSFLAGCFIINISPEIKERTIEIRKNYGLKVPDAIIAATAISKRLPFFSGDDVFHRVKELNFIHVQ